MVTNEASKISSVDHIPFLEQDPPDGLESVLPTTPENLDDKITETTTEMEYKLVIWSR